MLLIKIAPAGGQNSYKAEVSMMGVLLLLLNSTLLILFSVYKLFANFIKNGNKAILH